MKAFNSSQRWNREEKRMRLGTLAAWTCTKNGIHHLARVSVTGFSSTGLPTQKLGLVLLDSPTPWSLSPLVLVLSNLLFVVTQTVKCLPAMWETRVRFLGQEDPLEKEMAIHSSTLAWKIPWTEEPDRLQSRGSQRVGHDWATSLPRQILFHIITYCLCLVILKNMYFLLVSAKSRCTGLFSFLFSEKCRIS